MSNLIDTDSEDELPPGWEERVTLDGKVFYANHQDQCTQWTHPKSGKKKKVPSDMPYGWEQQIQEDGTIVYVNEADQKKTYTDPRLAFAQEDYDDMPTPGCTGFGMSAPKRSIFRSTSMSSGQSSPTSSSESEPRKKIKLDASITALQVLHGRDLSGKVAIVTGANCGIGYETSRALAHHGCHVVMAVRDTRGAQLAVDKIKNERPKATLSILKIDLSNLRSVENFVEQFQSLNLPLHYLILNAGIMGLPHQLTDDGFELTFQVNHLAHFYLVQLLLEDLVPHTRKKSSERKSGPIPMKRNPKTEPTRIVVLSSESHRFSFLNASNIGREYLSPPTAGATFVPMMVYNDSKLCNVLFARELAKRLKNYSVCAYSVHPGNMVTSSLSRNWWLYRLAFALVSPFTKSLEQGAATSVFAAVSPDIEPLSGAYLNNCLPCQPSATALDDELADKLWRFSEEMINDWKEGNTFR